jgi:nitrous oxidase accessory protein NosD
MWKRGVLFCCFTLFTSLTPLDSFGYESTSAPIANACEGMALTPRTAQRRLSSSTPGQTLCFSAGIYRHGLTVKEGQTLVAEDKTVLRGDGTGIGIEVKKGGSAIGFEVKRFAIGIKTVHYTTVANNYVHHNRQVGINAYGNGIVMRNNEIARNFWFGDESKPRACWGRGGAYMVNTRGLRFVRNRTHDNICDGVHFDVASRRAEVLRNRARRNTRFGIFFETSCRSTIRRNISRRNGGGGVGVSTSCRIRVHHNQFGDNGGKIGVLIWNQKDHQGRRCSQRTGHHRVYRNRMNGDKVIRRT